MVESLQDQFECQIRLNWKYSVRRENKSLSILTLKKRTKISTKVKYLGIQTDQHLNCNEHIKNIIPKLSRAIAVLLKICHYVPKFLLKTIFYSIFRDRRQKTFGLLNRLCLLISNPLPPSH